MAMKPMRGGRSMLTVRCVCLGGSHCRMIKGGPVEKVSMRMS